MLIVHKIELPVCLVHNGFTLFHIAVTFNPYIQHFVFGEF